MTGRALDLCGRLGWDGTAAVAPYLVARGKVSKSFRCLSHDLLMSSLQCCGSCCLLLCKWCSLAALLLLQAVKGELQELMQGLAPWEGLLRGSLGFDANMAFQTPLFQCQHWKWQILSLIWEKCAWYYMLIYAWLSILKTVHGPISYES